ncbi:Uncharacterised protein [Actinobacillus equuli]|nr:Uncharacterised protein [Actinobacillus equuli]
MKKFVSLSAVMMGLALMVNAHANDMKDSHQMMKDDKMMSDKHMMKDDKMMSDKHMMKDDKMMSDKHMMKDDK